MQHRLISAFLLLLLPSCAQPVVEARISREDVREICRAIRPFTSKPVTHIEADISTHNVAGSIPKDFVAVSSTGSRPIKRYLRSDLVQVTVAVRGDISGEVYSVHKIHGSWKVVGEGSWIQ